MVEEETTLIYTVQIDVEQCTQSVRPFTTENIVPFPEHGPYLTPRRAWLKYQTTRDQYGLYPMENTRNYVILGIAYLALIPFAIYCVTLVLN